jgi:hypothetical protein
VRRVIIHEISGLRHSRTREFMVAQKKISFRADGVAAPETDRRRPPY